MPKTVKHDQLLSNSVHLRLTSAQIRLIKEAFPKKSIGASVRSIVDLWSRKVIEPTKTVPQPYVPIVEVNKTIRTKTLAPRKKSIYETLYSDLDIDWGK